MTIKRKEKRQTENVTLMFDWAEGYLEVPRIDHLPASVLAMIEDASNTGDMLDILAAIAPDDIEFIVNLTHDELKEVLLAWVDRSQALIEFDEQQDSGSAGDEDESAVERVVAELNHRADSGTLNSAEAEYAEVVLNLFARLSRSDAEEMARAMLDLDRDLLDPATAAEATVAVVLRKFGEGPGSA